ncbi:hypothetical protein AnigIFM56816_006594 [Aspergillus niger]|nr:hypothetical protein AnigIFM56816_006594 [Aspergillus niger]
MGSIMLEAFNDRVADAIALHVQIPVEKIIILDNSVKYCPDGLVRYANKPNLAGIFDTMSNLNRMALCDSRLCTGQSQHGPSFHEALAQVTNDIFSFANGRPIRYIELGPEPWKSSAILNQLLTMGIALHQYIGIDINPESEMTMREALVPIIGTDRFSYLVRDFYQLSVSEFPELPDNCITVMTNLGFQEGNDLPSRIGSMLSRITRPGDLLLSEMQVFDDSVAGPELAAAPIKDFYELPEMIRFSAFVGQCFEDEVASQLHMEGESGNGQTRHLFYLVPLQTEVGSVRVATTLYPLNGSGDRKYVLTNSCLKYTPEQFKRARELSGNFVVRGCRKTGDNSVVFQIAERRSGFKLQL